MRFSSRLYFHLASDIAIEFSRSPEYRRVVDILYDCWKQGGTVFTMGCGGSASTATHFAADLAKTTNENAGFKTISLVDNIPLVSAWANDRGWDSVFEGQLQSWITDKDVLVGFSVHGGRKDWSQNLTNAMELAHKRGAKVIGFSGFDGGAMKDIADECLIVGSSSEDYGTPLVEAMHVVINHGIVFELKERMMKKR